MPPSRTHPPHRFAMSARLRRPLFGVTLLVLLLHAAVLGGTAAPGVGTAAPGAAAPVLTVRTIEPATAVAPLARVEAAPDTRPETSAAAAPATTTGFEPTFVTTTSGSEARADFDPIEATPARSIAEADMTTSRFPEPDVDAAVAIPAALDASQAIGASARADSGFMDVALPANAPATTFFLSEGERPPPVYKTLLPKPATLRYELRRSFLRGTAEIRWRPEGDRYTLKFDARVAGLTLLGQTSQGQLDATGVAPVRFLDQRAGKAQRAANFQRDVGIVSFSGPTTQYPLLAGTQDRLSWMIQLAGIVAAEPAWAREGKAISMVLVGARGDASVRSVRFAGRENVETAGGSVPALRFVVDSRGAYDGTFEIWLDPARDFLPVRADSRGPGGETEFELLLQRIEP